METKKINYATKNHLFGDGRASGTILFLSQEEAAGLLALEKNTELTGVAGDILLKLCTRLKYNSNENDKAPERKYATMIYENEYQDVIAAFADLSNCFVNEKISNLKVLIKAYDRCISLQKDLINAKEDIFHFMMNNQIS